MTRHRVVGGVLLERGRVLLCHRRADRTWFPAVWDLPGGHLEPGEAPHVALRRELAEELGIKDCVVGDHPLLAVFDAGLDLAVFAVTAWLGEVTNASPDEHDSLGWFTAAQLARLKLADGRYPPMLASVLATPGGARLWS